MSQLLFYFCMVVSGLLALLSLRNFYASPSKFGIVSGRVGMVVFAAMAAIGFWQVRELQGIQRTEYYELPTEKAGWNQITLQRPGKLRGYAGRLVMKEGRAPLSPAMRAKSDACFWEIPGSTAALVNERSGFLGWDWMIFDATGVEGSLDVRYQVTEETRTFLKPLLLEVTCSPGELEGVAIGRGVFSFWMAGFLLALLFASLGVTIQKRRLAKVPAPSA